MEKISVELGKINNVQIGIFFFSKFTQFGSGTRVLEPSIRSKFRTMFVVSVESESKQQKMGLGPTPMWIRPEPDPFAALTVNQVHFLANSRGWKSTYFQGHICVCRGFRVLRKMLQLPQFEAYFSAQSQSHRQPFPYQLSMQCKN